MPPRQRREAPVVETATADDVDLPSAAERKGMRGHDENGSVRPADGRWDLHEPAEESQVCVNETAPPVKRAQAKAKRKRD